MAANANGGTATGRSRIAVLGAGRLGTALVSLAARHGHRVTLASRSPYRLARVEDHALVSKTLSHRMALESSDLAFLAVACSESVTWTSKFKFPGAVGVPRRIPLLSASKRKPWGRLLLLKK